MKRASPAKRGILPWSEAIVNMVAYLSGLFFKKLLYSIEKWGETLEFTIYEQKI